MKRNIKILGTGSYLPQRKVSSEDLDRILGIKEGSCYKASHVRTRYWVKEETATQMASIASKEALCIAGMNAKDLDLIISTSGVSEQPIPCNASLIQEKLGLQGTGIACYDIDSTCLSFISGLEVASYLIEAGAYSKILLVSTHISSLSLDKNNLENFSNFGDGASSIIVGKSEDDSCITITHQETYSEGAHYTELIGGTSLVPPREYAKLGEAPFLFKMQGKPVFKLARSKMGGFLERACAKEQKKFQQVLAETDIFIPHQASYKALELMQRHLSIPPGIFPNEIENYGNMGAVSIPFMLDKCIREKKLIRGQTYVLAGTGAGLTIGFVKGIY
jgi:3-oxoacyl-[acyl-carrier-protein] synthase III